MHKALEQWKNEINEKSHALYYHPICGHCNTELFMSNDEFTLEKKEQSSKDDILSYKCPICGTKNKITRDDQYEVSCNYFGDKNIRFALDDLESFDARKFIKEHDHKDEFIKQNKIMFTAIGQQFTYSITPSTLGDTVSIRCNYCGKEKDITNTDNW